MFIRNYEKCFCCAQINGKRRGVGWGSRCGAFSPLCQSERLAFDQFSHSYLELTKFTLPQVEYLNKISQIQMPRICLARLPPPPA